MPAVVIAEFNNYLCNEMITESKKMLCYNMWIYYFILWAVYLDGD